MELKNIKYYEGLSQETVAFTASIYEGNKKVATVSNDGHGGCNNVQPVKDYTYNDVRKYATDDMECEIMGIAESYGLATKYQSKAVVGYKKETGQLGTLAFKQSIAKLKKMRGGPEAIDKAVNQLKSEGYTIMNRNL